MKISARNQLKGTVTGVKHGAVMSKVDVEIAGPNRVAAVITKEAAEELGLKEGDDVTVVIKATEVFVMK